jgi:hypothetical protein
MTKEINNLLNDNNHKDLERFLNQRKCLNVTNQWLLYGFHLIQSCGLLLTSYGTSVNNNNLLWIGISLNSIASLLHIYEKLNSNILKKLLNNIIMIKNGKYIDESDISPNLNQSTKINIDELKGYQSYQNDDENTKLAVKT